MGLYAAGKGLTRALEKLKHSRDWNAITDEMINDEEFFDLLDVQLYQSCYKEYRIP